MNHYGAIKNRTSDAGRKYSFSLPAGSGDYEIREVRKDGDTRSQPADNACRNVSAGARRLGNLSHATATSRFHMPPAQMPATWLNVEPGKVPNASARLTRTVSVPSTATKPCLGPADAKPAGPLLVSERG